jgi:hypothetical protein
MHLTSPSTAERDPDGIRSSMSRKPSLQWGAWSGTCLVWAFLSARKDEPTSDGLRAGSTEHQELTAQRNTWPLSA